MADASRAQGYSPGNLRLTLQAAKAAYEVFQQSDGRAAVLARNSGGGIGDRVIPSSEGVFTVTKLAGIELLDGGEVWWDHSANNATFRHDDDRDFYLGTLVGDAASADTTCVVNLNRRPEYVIDSRRGVWIDEATNGLGVTALFGGGFKLAFDAVTEAAQAAIYSQIEKAVGANCIFEARIAVYDGGDNAALDVDLGLASGSHATDFEAITRFAAFHFDGNAIAINAHSDDNATDVAPTATGVSYIAQAWIHLWIDTRDPASVKFYVDGVRGASATTFSWAAATGTMKAIVHMEKTSDDTPADFRFDYVRVRTAEQ